MIKIVDYHTHILPSMDDGAKDEQESLQMLNSLKQQQVSTICFTPHFYHFREDLQSFLKRREESYDKIQHLSEQLGIDFVLGAEVYFEDSILYLEDLKPLCLNNGRYLLLELPFDISMNDNLLQKIVKLKVNKQVTPIIAHVDRYNKIVNQSGALEELISIGCKIQMNLDAIDCNIFKRKKWINYMKDGKIHVFGSDCHNTNTRPPQYGIYAEQIKKLVDAVVFNKIANNKSLF